MEVYVLRHDLKYNFQIWFESLDIWTIKITRPTCEDDNYYMTL